MNEKLGEAGRAYTLTEKGRNCFGYVETLTKRGIITWENDEPHLHILKLMDELKKAEIYDSYVKYQKGGCMMARAVKCPVCGGSGKVIKPPMDTTAGVQYETCHGCRGKGWVEVSDR